MSNRRTQAEGGVIRIGSNPWCAAISATVFSPWIASKATRALNAAEWLRLGFFMDFVPPVRLAPGPKSTYTRVRKTGATSVLARGVFASVPDLKSKLMRCIRHYNQAPKTVKWKYFDPTRCITPTSAVTVD